MRRSVLVPLLGLLALPAACVAPKAPAPPPPPSVAPPQPPRPVPTLPSDWRDWPLAAGDWSYRSDANGSVASFGRIGAPADFTVQCDKATRRIALARPGLLDAGKVAQMTLRSTEGAGSYPVANLAGPTPRVAASLGAYDPLLDKLAFSRGRFLVQIAGAQDIVLPSWAEVARVVEDCRG